MGGMAKKDQDIYFCSRTSGYFHCNRILQTGTAYDYTDHVSAISFSYSTAWESAGEPSLWKKFLRLKVHSYDTTIDDFESEAFTLTCKQDIDWDTNTVATLAEFDFSGGSDGWGIEPWGTFLWGQARAKQLKRKMMSKKAKSARITFENSNLYENVLISGFEMQIVLPYRTIMHE